MFHDWFREGPFSMRKKVFKRVMAAMMALFTAAAVHIAAPATVEAAGGKTAPAWLNLQLWLTIRAGNINTAQPLGG